MRSEASRPFLRPAFGRIAVHAIRSPSVSECKGSLRLQMQSSTTSLPTVRRKLTATYREWPKRQLSLKKMLAKRKQSSILFSFLRLVSSHREKQSEQKSREKQRKMMQELDLSQRKFCEAPSGNNIRLLAPAGCGKTLCLLFRCKQLAERSLHSSRPRFLIVTFTRAAAGELRYRVNSDGRFSAIRDLVEISTLNAWGLRRVKSVTVVKPKPIVSKYEKYLTMSNQLQPIWIKYKFIKKAMTEKRNKSVAPCILMDVIDAFKSLGFNHVQHSNLGRFSQHLEKLQELDLTWNLEAQFEELAKLGVLDTKIIGNGAEVA